MDEGFGRASYGGDHLKMDPGRKIESSRMLMELMYEGCSVMLQNAKEGQLMTRAVMTPSAIHDLFL
jgi:hypothetical protein